MSIGLLSGAGRESNVVERRSEGENMDQERSRRRYECRHDPARVLTLTDGAFAIVITLLVLKIHVPELAGGKPL